MREMNDILAVILGGGRGTRLYPLTKQRSKPAVPMAGKYRLIDIPISNCINSGIYRIAVLTQFNSVSPAPPHLADLRLRRLPHRLGADLGRRADHARPPTGTRAPPTPCASSSSRSAPPRASTCSSWRATTCTAWITPKWRSSIGRTTPISPWPSSRCAREDTWRLGILKRDAGNRITNFAEKPKEPDAAG